MMLFDSHLDLALNGVDWNRDLKQTVEDIRAQEIALQMKDAGRQTNTLSLPELQRSELVVCLATLLSRLEPQINHSFGWITPEACYAMAHAHLAYYRAMEKLGHMRMIRTKSDLINHVEAYRQMRQSEGAVASSRGEMNVSGGESRSTLTGSNVGASTGKLPLGFILTMEGADPILDPENVFEYHQNGLRALGLTHYGTNRYGGGTSSQVGLALDAIPLLKNCESLGMTIDLTHLSDVAFWQVLEHFGGLVHASHQNARGICNWQRQFSDEQILAVAERGGVLGVAFDVIMLQEGYVRGITPPVETMEKAVDQIAYVADLTGSIAHVGIGSDLDGCYGNEQTPVDLNRYHDLQKLVRLMEKRGFTTQDIEAVFHKNWLAFFERALPD